MKPTSSDLIQRMLRNDHTSFEDIIDRYSEVVLRLCTLLLNDREEAKDIFQETLFRLVNMVQAGRFRSANGSIPGFLMTTARNLCLDRIKIRKRFSTLDTETETAVEELREMHTPDQHLEAMRFESAFDCALTQLTEVQRTVLVLHELNGESHKHIADTLQISIDSVKNHLCRARRKMRIGLAAFAGES